MNFLSLGGTVLFSKKLISLDIGSQNTKIVIGKYQKNKVYIERTIIVDTPLHTIEDGNIVDKLRLNSELKNTLGINSIKIKEVNCTTNSTSIINREIIIPKAEDGELDTIVNFEIQQYLPIIMEDYIIQHKVLETIKDEVSDKALEKLRIFVVVYPKHMAEGYLDMLKDAALKPNVLDVNFNAVNKLFADCVEINGEKYNTGDTIAVIDMGAGNLSVNIFSKGRIDFSRMTTNGGNVIDKHIAQEYDTTLEDAEKRKKQYCDLSDKDNSEKLEALNDIIKEDVNSWIEEINRILQFYKNKKIGNSVDRIFIYGGSSKLKGIEEYMSRALNIPVVKIKTISNIVLSKNVEKESLDLYLNAIGALIRL
jgi:type IV pilus assembly protein PilM